MLNTPVQVPKGSMIFIDLVGYSSRISLDTSGNSMYSDYFISGTTLTRLNSYENWRFKLRAIIEQPYYENLLEIPVRYGSFGRFNLTAKISDISSNEITRTVLINNGKIFLAKLFYDQN